MSRERTLRSWASGWTMLIMAVAVLGLAATAPPALAAHRSSTLENLLGRAQIQNMLTDYYAGLGAASHDMGSFYAPDGVVDVNGIVAKGPKAIDALYKKIAGSAPIVRGESRYNMLITNLKIVVHGDTATSENIWTGVLDQTRESTPRFVEQGHEHDVLVKLHGHWYFKHRVIVSDAGLAKNFRKNFEHR